LKDKAQQKPGSGVNFKSDWIQKQANQQQQAAALVRQRKRLEDLISQNRTRIC